eukprot:TRINITY_DN26679_c0_g1_i13.p2 TRINITY_DN26679_c0_g1~~TRINITY_DN26679_c0_g1_i13.p2  ORF type:complete len:106 (-),score=13.75 TRINITY_DN26679_c0_g1_i13:107-424(-)
MQDQTQQMSVFHITLSRRTARTNQPDFTVPHHNNSFHCKASINQTSVFQMKKVNNETSLLFWTNQDRHTLSFPDYQCSPVLFDCLYFSCDKSHTCCSGCTGRNIR